MNPLLERLRYHVTGAIERGEAEAIVEVRAYAQFDRFDICEAHAAIECDYNVGGWLRERPSNQRRREATAVQLHRMHFRAGRTNLGIFEALTENGKAIYRELQARYGFTNEEAAS